jgi:phosphonate transport system ATP-binding protein
MTLALHELSKAFGTTVALDRVSFALRPGEVTALLGPSGSGKSTLFNCVMGLVRPDTGQVFLDGTDLTALRSASRRRHLRSVGLVFQRFNLVERHNAIDNVLIGRLAHVALWRVLARRFPDAERQRALAALDSVGLLERAYQRAGSLSGGQQQRVAIARVLAQGCTTLLADEPVASLDPEAARNVLSTLRAAARDKGIAVLVSLHQLNYALEFADRVIALREGRVHLDTERAQLAERDLEGLYVRQHVLENA